MVDEYIPEPASLEEAIEMYKEAKKNLKDFEEKYKKEFPSSDLPPDSAEIPEYDISLELWTKYRKLYQISLELWARYQKLVDEVIRTANIVIKWKNIERADANKV